MLDSFTLNEPDLQKSLYEACIARKSTDPWLMEMLEGRQHIKLAWDLRGSGFADTVTPEGWRGFFQ